MDYLLDTDGMIDKVAIVFKGDQCHYRDTTGKNEVVPAKDEITIVKQAIETAEKLGGTVHIRTTNERAFRLVNKHNSQRKYQIQSWR